MSRETVGEMVARIRATEAAAPQAAGRGSPMIEMARAAREKAGVPAPVTQGGAIGIARRTIAAQEARR